MMKMPQRIITLLNWSSDHYWHFVSGVFFAFLSYFSEMEGAFLVMFACFVIDMILGILASKIMRKQKFSMQKAFTALYRMLISYTLVMLLYAMDKEMNQQAFSMSNIAAWLISGFLIYSAAENGFELTGGKLFLSIKTLIKKKVQENTGIDISATDTTQTPKP